ncbi:MAG: acyltransferase [Kiritimatiellae bacterium]|nr:acyltransferase [Kiritimatiellia bacterium]
MSSSFRQIAKRIVHAGLPVPRFIRPIIVACYQGGVFCVESGAFLLKLFWVEPILRSICESVGTHLRAERLPYMRGKGRIRIGNHVNLSGRSCFYFIHNVSEQPLIEIGDHTFVGNGCTFSAGREIRVGAHCLISALVRIHDNDGHPLDIKRRLNHEPIGDAEVAPVIIGDNVWIGAGATILKGVSVGDGSVIGTGAVVTADVPAGTVVAGNPAKVVKTLA